MEIVELRLGDGSLAHHFFGRMVARVPRSSSKNQTIGLFWPGIAAALEVSVQTRLGCHDQRHAFPEMKNLSPVTTAAYSCAHVCTIPHPLFLVSADSKGLSFSVS